MKGKGFFSAIMLVWSLLLPIAAFGTTYYVAPGGNNSNPGTLAKPWRTITKAAQTLVAGDTVYIRAGTYSEQVTPQNSGRSGQYIVYAAYPGETVTIDGSGITLPDDLYGVFHIANKSYLKVSGLRVINAGFYNDNAGIMVRNSDYITIEKNYTSHTWSSGIGVWESTNIVIDGNEVNQAGSGGWQECISIAQTGFFEVKNNHVHHGYKEGICAKQGAHDGKIYRNHVHDVTRVGIYVDAHDQHTYHLDLYQNRVHDTGNNGFALASEQGGLLENIRIYNNLAYQNYYSGICLSHEPSELPQPVKNVTMINNTCYQNGNPEPGWGGGISLENTDVAHVENIVIRNNICSENAQFQIQHEYPESVTSDHNLVWGVEGYAENDGTAVVEADPLFINPTDADFYLQSTSPAINQGAATDAPTVDFDGQARPQAGAYDIGAYEFRSGNAYLLWTK
ncbi:hypothetical protein U27_04751 [Candidatus Vecturithrix granuli]|uniref:Uncharacterized protein n=1 Tax=Vecturithrix granuli TaxID=1499967 RepID=A0A081BZM9_VECG1|nr:hypothetical protein U27_04751 [Candidatus Vecturithrix granuli]